VLPATDTGDEQTQNGEPGGGGGQAHAEAPEEATTEIYWPVISVSSGTY
jgi:hypothetical protein